VRGSELFFRFGRSAFYLPVTVETIIEKPPAPRPDQRAWWAYVGPFGAFLLLLTLPGLIAKFATAPTPPLWIAKPEFWVYPLQTLVCAAMLFYFRREYPLENRRPGAIGYGALIGLVALVVWLAPQLFFHAAPRLDGFDPTLMTPGSPEYYWTVGLRFARLVVIVPIMEEVFWRGFLLRYLVREDFVTVPLGTFTWLSFGATAIGFMLEHSFPDYPAALVTGVLYNLVAVQTRSLPACIVAHAATNLLLGIYIMRTHQWGFW
jgi:CAAX prenyl protease-like protein